MSDASSIMRARSTRFRYAEYAGMLAVLAMLILFFSLQADHFFSRLTFTTLANQIPSLTVIAVGMTFVLIIAGIDLSVGSVMALSAAVLGVVLVQWEWSLAVSALACLLVGLASGFVNGFITVRWAVPSFIVTLGMLEAARGAAYLVTDSQSLYIGTPVAPIGTPIQGIGLSPAFFIAVAVVLIGQMTLSRTVFGRYMVATGTNEEAVRLSGIEPGPIKLAVFTITGFLAGLGGLFHVAYLESSDPNAGIGMELSVIAAVVIGGTSLMGGRGSVVNSFLGVLIIAVLQAGLAQMGATEPVKRVVTGAVIVAAVIADVYRHRMSGSSIWPQKWPASRP